ncbi:MAG: hypothetical protein GC179_06780 [Anaerolineaceae bacterium]|nr:hypothetical protein [Anaerolineaceae bacterium]
MREPNEGPSPTTTKAERPKVVGGKSLFRLLDLLDSAGYTEAAQQSVELAVDEEQRPTFATQAAQYTASPTREAAGDAGKTSKSSTRRSRAADQANAVSTENIAQNYIEAADRLSPPQPFGPQWRSLGPWTVPNGQTYGSGRVNISGRISAIAVDPNRPAHVLAGAANGGVWESFDRGASWSPRTDYAATLTVGAIAFDRRNTSVVYCGTGEGNWWAYLGAGILRSTNGGTTWTTLCQAPFVGQGFYSLIVDPGDSNHLLAGTTSGLYVSTNGGVNWTQRRTSTTWAISINPAGGTSAEILAACRDGLWRSTNGGTSWTAVTLPSAPASFNRLAVSIAPSNPQVAYAWGANGATAQLWRRTTTTWAAITIPPGVSTGQAWYDWYVEASPDRTTEVYCGAIDAYRGNLSGTTWTWTNLSSKSGTGSSIHPDQHAIAFEPGQPNTIYCGNDGGLYRSPDRGITWQHCNNGLVISEYEYIDHDYGSSRFLIGGTQDNGTERWTGSMVWEHIADGDGGDCAINRTDPNIVFHSYYGVSPERSSTRGNFGSWTGIAPSVPSGESSLFYPPFECSANGGDTIALGGQSLFVSRNNGTAWVRLALPSGSLASAMYIPNVDNVFVGTTDGRIFKTHWGGSSWSTPSALTTPRSSASLSDIFVDSSNLNRLWATYRTVGGGRVYRSDDGGSHWIDRTAGLPNLPMNAVAVDNWNSNRVWVAADLGVYQTTDGGATWGNYSNALPNAFVGDLIFHPHARVLRAGTRNRGVWEIPVDGWMTQPICGVQWTGHLLANQTKRWFTWGWPATWHMIWTVMPTTVRPGSPQILWKTQVERASAEFATYWITVQNLTSAPIDFEGRYCILSRY